MINRISNCKYRVTCSRGFTLVEIAIVMALIGMLMVMTLPLMKAALKQGGKVVTEQSKTHQGLIEYTQIQNALVSSGVKDDWQNKLNKNIDMETDTAFKLFDELMSGNDGVVKP